MEVTFTRLIESSIDHHCFDNAIFIAERYAAHHHNSEEALNVLGTCYIKSGKYAMAYDRLKRCSLPDNRYLFAIAAWKIGKLAEAVSALNPSTSLLNDVPKGEYGLYILGSILMCVLRY